MATLGLRAAVMLAQSRDGLTNMFAQLYLMGASGKIPCAAIALYNSLRERHMRLEGSLVGELRRLGRSVPEAAPRSLPILGACSPGATETVLSKESLAAASRLVGAAIKEQRLADQVIAKAVATNPMVKEVIDEARGQVQAQVPPRHFFTLGGIVAPPEMVKPANAQPVDDFDEREAVMLAHEIRQGQQTLGTMLSLRGPGDAAKTPTRWWIWALAGGGGLLAVGAGVWYFVSRRRAAAEAEAEAAVALLPEGPEEEESEDGSDDRPEDRSRPHRPRHRRRRGVGRRRGAKRQEASEFG